MIIRITRKHARTLTGVLLFTVLSMFCAGSIAQAVGDQFIIGQPINGVDNEPPTVPGALTATSVATSQIDLAWTASTDNVAVTGYQVFRDGAPIATTTLLTYSDTGLTASTTYGYTVRAFDAALNYSTSTATSTATTLATSTPTTTPNLDGDGGPRVELPLGQFDIESLLVAPGIHDATITWRTSRHAQTVLRWGVTGSYEMGSLQGEIFSKDHFTKITGLESDTVYLFELQATDAHGNVVIETGKFRTTQSLDLMPPHNVTDLIAYPEGDDIVLEWRNPTDADFRHVRIIRNDSFYPSDPYDGYLTYEDDGEQHRDEGAAQTPGFRYYTVFSYDHRGNISSGAVVRVQIGDVEEPDYTGTTTLDIDFSDIAFFQDHVALPTLGDQVHINGEKELIISIEYELLPEHLKTVLVTIEDPEESNKTFSFLLRINHDKSRYEAVIAPFGRSGIFPVTVNVFDFKLKTIGSATGQIISTVNTVETEEEAIVGFLQLLTSRPFFFWLFLLVLLLIARKLISKYGVGKRKQEYKTV